LRINWNPDADELERGVGDMEKRCPEPDGTAIGCGEKIRSPHMGNELIGCCEAGEFDNFLACAAQHKYKQLMGPLIFVIDVPYSKLEPPRRPGFKFYTGAIETGP
jgi:hypothetical protein